MEVEPPALQEVVCPHCKKPFRAPLLAGRAARHRGYKCPLCKLFVPERPNVDGSIVDESAG